MVETKWALNEVFSSLQGPDIRKDVLDSHCWVNAHFNLPEEFKSSCSGLSERVEGTLYDHKFQWIPLFLLGLAILFYLPR